MAQLLILNQAGMEVVDWFMWLLTQSGLKVSQSFDLRATLTAVDARSRGQQFNLLIISDG